MTHAVSALSFRFERMSPLALALTVLLHVLVVLALWWMSLNRPELPAEDPITVTFEQPKQPDPPALPEKAPSAPLVDLGLRPPADITADKPTQVPPKVEHAMEALLPRPSSPETVMPGPQAPPLPSPEASLEPPMPMLPPQAHASPAPAPVQPTAPAQRPPARPSPIASAPQQRPPAVASLEAPPSTSPFVNPADAYNRARVSDNYLWQVARKLVGYQYFAEVNVSQGTTVVRIVIARDGRLLAVDVAQSSGVPVLDQGVVAGVRAGSPYAPLPPAIKGDSAAFTLPVVSTTQR